MAASFIINYFAGMYTERIALWIFIIFLILREPERLPYIIKSITLFVFIRSIFITLTHLGAIPDGIPLSPDNPIKWLTFGTVFFLFRAYWLAVFDGSYFLGRKSFSVHIFGVFHSFRGCCPTWASSLFNRCFRGLLHNLWYIRYGKIIFCQRLCFFPSF